MQVSASTFPKMSQQTTVSGKAPGFSEEPIVASDPEFSIAIPPASTTDVNEKDEDIIGPAPDGGVRAWLVAGAAACIFFSAMGYSNTFGAFQEYYQSHQLADRSPDDIAWIGSTSAFLMFASGAIGGPLFDRYGVKVRLPISGNKSGTFMQWEG
jgi:hypothetical protein